MIGTSLDEAVAIIKRGGVVAFPTETYYGLGVDPDNEKALAKLFFLKRRQSGKAILLLIEAFSEIDSVAASVPDEYLPLIKRYWPGALTLVFPAKKTLSPLLTAGSSTIGVRVSPHPVARELVRKMGKAITATSANVSGHSPAKSALEAKNIFAGGVDYILDGGETRAGRCSTLVGLHNRRLVLLRQGMIDLAAELDG